MCGIVGLINTTEKSDALIKEMAARITHRGPDDEGFFVTEKVALGMRRLSIIDLAHGKQPIYSTDGRKVIVFNGEIYNYKELRAELAGETFTTDTDTEVILKLYEKYGEKSVENLRGMFAFAIYNLETGETFLARDHFGIKPLYYLIQDSRIIAFGSEIKSLLLHPSYKKEFNSEILGSYLRFQYNPRPETFFKNIFKFPPGHFMKIQADGAYSLTSYFDPRFADARTNDFEKAVTDTREIMKDSVSHHMIADVEVGSFLSGGVDSSIIVSLMQLLRKDKVKTFTVGFKELSEGEEAKETALASKTDHHEILVTKENYFNALKDAAWHFDEPVADPSAIALYFLAQEASKHVKVVLSGEGADEFFGGYNVYREPYTKWVMKYIPKIIKTRILAPLTKSSWNFYGKNYLKRALGGARGWYIGNAQVWTKEEVNTLLKKQSKEYSLENLYGDVATLPDSEKMQHIDIHTWLVGDILQKADKMSMAHSLEVRVPFLDKEVFALTRTFAPSIKWERGETKRVLRKAFENIIPVGAQKRKKLGFPIPLATWLKEDPSQLSSLSGSTFLSKYMNTKEVERLVQDHTTGTKDNARKLYTLLLLDIWHKTFFD